MFQYKQPGMGHHSETFDERLKQLQSIICNIVTLYTTFENSESYILVDMLRDARFLDIQSHPANKTSRIALNLSSSLLPHHRLNKPSFPFPAFVFQL